MEELEGEDRGAEYGLVLNSENMGERPYLHFKSVWLRVPHIICFSAVETRVDVLWQDDGIIAPSDTRDVLGLGLDLAADEHASRSSGGAIGGGRGEIGADGDGGDWGVFRM